MKEQIAALRLRLTQLDNQIDYLECKQGFVPRALKEEYWQVRNELEKLTK